MNTPTPNALKAAKVLFPELKQKADSWEWASGDGWLPEINQKALEIDEASGLPELVAALKLCMAVAGEHPANEDGAMEAWHDANQVLTRFAP